MKLRVSTKYEWYILGNQCSSVASPYFTSFAYVFCLFICASQGGGNSGFLCWWSCILVPFVPSTTRFAHAYGRSFKKGISLSQMSCSLIVCIRVHGKSRFLFLLSSFKHVARCIALMRHPRILMLEETSIKSSLFETLDQETMLCRVH